jgi:hypothetical protein
MPNMYRLNKDYIKAFQIRISERYKDRDKRSETGFFKVLLEEMNELFKNIGGKVSSKKEIPSSNDYPDSEVYNKLLVNVSRDIDKLFNAQKLIESDINNLMNFNSIQRTKTFENFTSAQQEVYSAYVKANREAIGGTRVPEGNPFTSSDNMSTESEDVIIDEHRSVLTLKYETTTEKNIDIKNTTIYFAGKQPERPLYPMGSTLAIGSHWKITKNDPHFIDSENIGSVEQYKTMMIDDPNSNIGIGYCEFEAVSTKSYGMKRVSSKPSNRIAGFFGLKPILMPIYSRMKSEDSSILSIKEYIGQVYNKDPEFIYADLPNSLQGQYVLGPARVSSAISDSPKYKLVVPLLTSSITNEFIISFMASRNGYIPKINWSESKAFSRDGGSDIAYSLIPPHGVSLDSEPALDGKYVCHISDFIRPTRLEIVVEYDSDQDVWEPIDFYMSHYVYSVENSYEMPFYGYDSKINVLIKKSYDIFVDAEANETKERDRAINVIKNPNRSSK